MGYFDFHILICRCLELINPWKRSIHIPCIVSTIRPSSEPQGLPSSLSEVVRYAHIEPWIAVLSECWGPAPWLILSYFPTHSTQIIKAQGPCQPNPIIKVVLELQLLRSKHYFPRLLLCEDLQWFGAGTLQDQLDIAYDRYRAYCRVNRVKQSQPPFKVKMVTWQFFILYFVCQLLPIIVFWYQFEGLSIS